MEDERQDIFMYMDFGNRITVKSTSQSERMCLVSSAGVDTKSLHSLGYSPFDFGQCTTSSLSFDIN